MVKEAQGTTDLKFPSLTAEVGDINIGITNNFPYELMSDGRWRNVNLPAVLKGFYNPENPDLPTEANRYLPIPHDQISDKSYELTLYDKDTIGGQLARMTRYYDDTPFDADAQGELLLEYPNADRVYRIIDINDESIPFYETITDKGIDYGTWQISGSANNIPSFNNPYSCSTWFDIDDLVYNNENKDKCKVRFRWYVSKGLPNSSTIHRYHYNMFPVEYTGRLAIRNYHDGSGDPNAVSFVEGNEDFPSPSDAGPTKEVITPWTDIPADARWLWFQIDWHAGQRMGGWVIEILDPEYPGDPSIRNLSGIDVNEDEDKLYTSHDLINEVRQYNLSSVGQIDSGVLSYEEEVFYDPTAYPAPSTITPADIDVSKDGRFVYICDAVDGKIKQWTMRTVGDLSTMIEYDPFNSWNYNTLYKEFSTVANPICCQVSINGENLYTLEDDNNMRRYSLTGRDVSTAVFEDSFSLDALTLNATCFCLSPTEGSLVIAESGLLHEIFMSTKPSLSVPLSITPPREFDIDDPTGVQVSRDGTRIYVSDKSSSSLDIPQKVKQFNQ